MLEDQCHHSVVEVNPVLDEHQHVAMQTIQRSFNKN